MHFGDAIGRDFALGRARDLGNHQASHTFELVLGHRYVLVLVGFLEGLLIVRPGVDDTNFTSCVPMWESHTHLNISRTENSEVRIQNHGAPKRRS